MTSTSTARILVGAVAIAGLVVAAVIIGLWPETIQVQNTDQIFATDVVPARVVSADLAPCLNVPDLECVAIEYEITGGDDTGRRARQDFFGDPTDPDLVAGDRVVLNYVQSADPEFQYSFADRERRNVLWTVAGLFALAVVALGGWRGVAGIAALAMSFLLLLWFVLPSIVNGANPVVTALVGASAIAYVALYIGHGFTLRTTVALAGALCSLAAVAGLSWIVLALANVSGFTTEEALYLPLLSQAFDVRGLVLAGVVLGTMGALDDVTVTQTEAVWELRAASREMPRADIFAAALRIGRAHIGSTVNTLALAYAGASLPLLLLFVISQQSLGTVANSEVVATEIIRTLVGSMGLVTSVPLTTWLATVVVPDAAEGHMH
ncbi:MAG: YibE/F family protein [Acidimicrobiia bacterium]|nr:YibE/F family protein [Acidimicrobiia bacterium]